MLNELKMLADSIEVAGFKTEDWDDTLKEVKTSSPCFVVYVSDNGEIAEIRFLDKNKVCFLKTWLGGSYGETFPSLNFTPFYKFDEDKKKSNKKPSKEELKMFLEVFKNGSGFVDDSIGAFVPMNRDSSDKKVTKCLGKIASDFFSIVIEREDDENSPFVKFKNVIMRFVEGENIAETLNKKIIEYLRKNLTSDDIQKKDSVWSILLSSKNNDVVLYFDICETPDNPMDYPIASEKAMNIINKRIIAKKNTAKEKLEAIDAFGKKVSFEEMKEKLPEVKLPGVLANTKLRSMNSESACQMRYRHIDAKSFPVGSEIRKSTKAALSWISSPEREGKTWAKAGSNELVFAYPKSMPPSPPLLARLFGNGYSISDQEQNLEARFEQYAEDALQGIKKLKLNDSHNTEIEVFAIKKADKARRKVAFYRNYSVEMLEDAVNSWRDGANNIPNILLYKWPIKKDNNVAKPVICEFQAPLPLITTTLVYRSWRHDNSEKMEPKYHSENLYDGFPVFDGLELFLGGDLRSGLADRMMHLLLQGIGNLCINLGNLTHKHKMISNYNVVKFIENSIPLLGILLYKLNRRKDNYMQNPPYLIGKFLNLADGLHAIWCKNVRNNQLPPQLLGSSLYSSFQINPIQGFANAAIRIKPYLDWAKTNMTEDVAIARWYVGEFSRVTTLIKEKGIPSRFSDADKAEMLLGYLSSPSKNINQSESNI